MQWIQTDTGQWMAKDEDGYWHGIEAFWWVLGKNYFFKTTEESDLRAEGGNDRLVMIKMGPIDFDEYNHEIPSILKRVGYDSVDNIKEIYGDSWTQILAECIFEECQDQEPEIEIEEFPTTESLNKKEWI